MIKVSGKVEYRAIAVGAWALVTKEGKIYELYNHPQDLKQDGITIEVEGVIRDDVMTISMIGKILEVRSFTIKS